MSDLNFALSCFLLLKKQKIIKIIMTRYHGGDVGENTIPVIE